MRIGEVSRRTGVPARMLRYYEEQGLLSPERAGNGYRAYSESTVERVRQIRGLLDCGLTTEIIRIILPCLDGPDHIYLLPENLSPRTAELLRDEIARIQQRIDCLTRNRDAVLAYLAAAQSGIAPCAGSRRTAERSPEPDRPAQDCRES
ncbi:MULTISPECIES: MerR family transcriptional regulator [Pseudofrankia]|uniref:MerR family transcriptional regulator n=1 Tax=Pseudofrankia TaxID=2994363 RepID=UPI000234B452|nr:MULTISPECIES: MerR family transcriptional regulator [Pseudofrankia]